MIPQFNVYLCTVNDVQSFQLLENSNADWTAGQVALLKMFIRRASQQIVTHLNQLPLPYIDTREFDYTPQYITPDLRCLLFDAPLLSVTTLTNGNGESIGAGSYTLKPNNQYPKRRLELTYTSQGYFTYPTNGNTSQIVSLAGQWGYVPHYGREWRDSGQNVPVGGLDATSTSMVVASGTPFMVGDYIRIDSEFLFVDNVATNTLTLERGVLGSTAAAHDATTDIEIFTPLDDIRFAATEWAAYLYKARTKVGDRVTLYNQGSTAVVNDLSPLVRQALEPHRYRTFGSV